MSTVSADRVQTRDEKIALRRQFLEGCGTETVGIHSAIIDPDQSQGRINPLGRGGVARYSGSAGGQSTVIFESLAEYRDADRSGRSRYGGAEYGVVETVESARLCEKFSELHTGHGAVALPSGLSAIKTVMDAFLKTPDGKPTILIPSNRYYPTERLLRDMQEFNPQLMIVTYSGNADRAEIENHLGDIAKAGRTPTLIYLEAPGSHTFEIADISGIVALAKERGIKTAMDNSWASHVRFKPLKHGIDIAIQSTTKYEGGFGDTPSGIVIARDPQDFAKLARAVRISGNGAIDPQTCRRLYNRVDSTEERMNRHFSSAVQVAEYLKAQPFVKALKFPPDKQSPDHGRFQTYYNGLGNGLLTAEFTADFPVDKFSDGLYLHRIGESWGGHVSLILPSYNEHALRFSEGLEEPEDLIRDIRQSAEAALA